MYSPIENGKVLRELRLKLGKTQEEVANRIGVSRAAIGMYENGTRNPDDETKIRLADFYHRSVSYIFFGNNPTK